MSMFHKNSLIYLIVFAGLILRILSYCYLPNYKPSDGYIYHGRVLYESKAHGRDRQFFKDLSGADKKTIDSYFSNPSSPIINKNGKEIILTATHPIGWPLQIALLYSIFGNNNVDAVLIYSLIISTFTILVFYLISRNLFNIPIALITASIAALNPIFVLQSSTTTTETTFLFFLMLSLFFFLKGFNNKRIFYYILFGSLLGFTSLIRPVAFLYIFALIFFLTIFKQFQKGFLISLVAFFIVLSPWVIRNYIVFHSFIPMTNLSGIVFYQGNNKYVFNEGHGSWLSQEVLWDKSNRSCLNRTELEVKNMGFRDGLKFLKTLTFTELIQHELYKLRYAFGLSPKYVLYRPGSFNFSIRHKIVYFPLCFLTIIYFAFLAKRDKSVFKRDNYLFYIIVISALMVYLVQTLIFFGYPRYRAYLLDPFLIFTASLSIYHILRWSNSIFRNRHLWRKILP